MPVHEKILEETLETEVETITKAHFQKMENKEKMLKSKEEYYLFLKHYLTNMSIHMTNYERDEYVPLGATCTDYMESFSFIAHESFRYAKERMKQDAEK